MPISMRTHNGSRLRFVTAKTCCASGFAMMAKVSNRRDWKKVEKTGVWESAGCVNVPTESGPSLIFGVNREKAPKFSCSSRLRSPTKVTAKAIEPNWFERCGVVHSAHSLIRILTVDDHPILRKGLAALVNAEPD